jgi:hypothetical protein
MWRFSIERGRGGEKGREEREREKRERDLKRKLLWLVATHAGISVHTCIDT